LRRCLFLFGLLLLAGCTPAAAPGLPPARHSIVYGLTLLPSGFDPHIHQSSELGIPLRQVYDTLIYRDPTTGEFVPGLATNWTISDDGLVYTFTLRQGVKFHDGTPFNAQAVAANLDRITSPETASQKAVFMLGTYTGYEVVDEQTIRLILSEPYSPLLDSLSQVYLGIASPTALSQYSDNRYQFHQVGTGPFRWIEYVPGEKIVLRRNPDYAWGPPFYAAPGENSVDEVVFRFYTDPATRALALERGEAHIMGELPPNDARSLTGNSDIQLLPVSVPGQPLQFLMNTQRFPTDNLAVRQALILGTNRNAIIDTVYQRFSPVAWGPLSANTVFYNRGVSGVYATDTGQAQELLANAGFSDTDGTGYLDFSGIDVEVTIIVPPWGFVPQTAQLLQDQWRALGIKTTLEAVPTFSGVLEAVDTGEYNLVAFNSFGIDPALLNPFYLSDGANNWTGYTSAELDNLLREGMRQNSIAARLDLYAQAQAVIVNEALILPIRDYVNLNAASTRVHLGDPAFDAYGWFPLLNNATIQS
jgi:peptide/nickel transport system substrate-binding protein